MHVQKITSAWYVHKKRIETQIKNIDQWSSTVLPYLKSICSGVRFLFRKCVLPEGLAKEPPQIRKNPKCLDLIGYTMFLTVSTCKLDTKHTPDAFKYIPDQFGGFFWIKIEGKLEKSKNSRKLVFCTWVYDWNIRTHNRIGHPQASIIL